MSTSDRPRAASKIPAIVAISIVAALIIACGGTTNTDSGSGGQATTPQTTAPKDPNTITDNGVLLVPDEAKPGTYSTTVPDDGFGCYWARLKNTNNDLDSIIANGNGEPGDKLKITIKPTDTAFETRDCGPWKKIG